MFRNAIHYGGIRDIVVSFLREIAILSHGYKGFKMILDIQTIRIAHFFSQFLVTVFMLFIWQQNRGQIKGINYWMLNLVLQTIGMSFFAFSISPATTGSLLLGPIAAAMIVTGALLFFFGFAEFSETSIDKRPYYLLIVAFVVISTTLNLIFGKNQWTFAVFTLVVLVIMIRYLALFIPLRKSPYGLIFNVLSVIYTIFVCSFSLRFVYTLFPSLFSFSSLCGESFILATTGLGAMLLLTGANYCVILLINQKLIFNLERHALVREEVVSDLRNLADIDGLTDLYNRRALENFLKKKLSIARKTQSRFTILLIDIDNFKQINDSAGHDEGDRVLQAIASVLKGQMRKQELVGRWGGDEFLVICDSTSGDDISYIANRLRKQIRLTFSETNIKTTVSIGSAISLPDDTETSLLKRADMNMYRAKDEGKNRAILE